MAISAPVPHESRRPQVMLAEDDPEMSHVLEFLLRRQGFVVEAFADGRDAVRRIETGPPADLLLVDVMMPFVNGLHVVRALRLQQSWQGVPAIVLSGKSAEADIVEAFDAGASDYVTKPFKPNELIARVRALLNDRRGNVRVVA